MSDISVPSLGSPPQVRGKPASALSDRRILRITPAGAGKTRFRPPTVARDRDHPRRCGENTNDETSISAHTGITPAGAGKTERLILDAENLEDHPRRCGENVVRSQILLMHLWITPAGAGKTPDDIQFRTADEDHPRRCGENIFSATGLLRKVGSPPQVRGKRAATENAAALMRITPAGAGKTTDTRRLTAHCTDHPRRCGENLQNWHG